MVLGVPILKHFRVTANDGQFTDVERKFEVYQNTMVTHHFFPKGNNICDCPFTFLDEEALPKWGQLLKKLLLTERIH